jgi:hypothetical protein
LKSGASIRFTVAASRSGVCDKVHICERRQKVLSGSLRQPARRVFCGGWNPRVIFEGDLKMELAQQVAHRVVKSDERNRDMTVILGYSILAVLMLMAIVLAFGGPGVSPEDLASMSVFP